LSCLSLPDFSLYQTFADGREENYQITSFIPETLKAMQRQAVSHKKLAADFADKRRSGN
jgi:hypothetical protein